MPGVWIGGAAASGDLPDPTSCPLFGGDAQIAAGGAVSKAFPGFVVTDDGTFVVAYRRGASHNSTDGTIRVITSTDQAQSWSAETTVMSNAAWDFRDPSLTRLADGRLVLHASRRTSAGAEDPSGAVISFSDDNGATWGAVSALTESFTDWVYGGAPILEVPSTGDLLAPIYGEDTGDTYWSVRLLRSTDGGTTWTYFTDVADGPADSRSYNETGLVWLGDGNILAVIRQDNATRNWWTATSADNGANWSTPTQIIADAAGWPKPYRLPDGRIVAVYRDHLAAGKPGQIVVSYDDGATWDECAALPTVADQYAYSQADVLDGRLYIVHSVEDGDPPASVYITSAAIPTVAAHTHHRTDIVDLWSEHNELPGRSEDNAHPISAITGLQAALDASGSGATDVVFAPAYTVTDGTTLDLDITFVWGIDGGGDAYYNAAGVTAGDEAVLVLDTTTGSLSLRPVEV